MGTGCRVVRRSRVDPCRMIGSPVDAGSIPPAGQLAIRRSNPGLLVLRLRPLSVSCHPQKDDCGHDQRYRGEHPRCWSSHPEPEAEEIQPSNTRQAQVQDCLASFVGHYPRTGQHPPMYLEPAIEEQGASSPAAAQQPHRDLERAQCWITTGAVTITAISARISCHSGADMSPCDSRWPEE
jgi:hypothetical protein